MTALSAVKDIDYLVLSSRIRAMERNLLSAERMERMLEARSNAEAAKVLSECGWPDLGELTSSAIDRALAAERSRLLADLAAMAPQPAVLDVFRVRYDYHNAKVLLKAEAMETNPGRMLVDAGRVPADALAEGLRGGDLRGMPNTLRSAVAQAREVLGATGDPQLCDLALDRACYQDMLQIARELDSDFLTGYVRAMIDGANLRAAVRAVRMGRGAEFLKGVLFPGGNVAADRLLANLAAGSSFQDLYVHTPLERAAEAGAAALGGGPLTAFEKLCDDALNRYAAEAKHVPFGQAPLVGYLAAKETELTNIRVILTGRLAGLDADTIRERLREAYV